MNTPNRNCNFDSRSKIRRPDGVFSLGCALVLAQLLGSPAVLAAGVAPSPLKVAEAAGGGGSSAAATGSLPGGIYKASALIGQKVKNQRGEDIGEITDLALSPSQGRVSYAVLSFGGLLGVGDKRFAVPTTAFTRDRDQLVLNVSEQQLKSMQGFDDDHWPKRAERWPGAAVEPTMSGSGGQAAPIVKASEFIDGEVKSGDGKELGEIEDLAVDLRSGRIGYVVIEHGGLLGMGEKLAAIPATELSPGEESDEMVLRAGAEALDKARNFSEDNWPATSDSVSAAPGDRVQSAGSATTSVDDAQKFGELDRDANGYLSKSEAAAEPGLEKQYDSLDSNHDGRLEKVEFAPFEAKQGHEPSGAAKGEGQTPHGGTEPVIDPAGSADWKGPTGQPRGPQR